MDNAIFIAVLTILVAGRLYFGHLAAQAFDGMPAEAKKRLLAAQGWTGSY